MADPLLGVVLQNLNSLIYEEFSLIWGFHKDMKKLSNTLSTIRDVLEDAEVKQLKDKAIRRWLKKLKDAAYDADDILDECALEALQAEATSANQSCNKFVRSSFLSCFSFERIPFRHKMGQRISEIRERIDEIAGERLKFHLREGVVDRGIGIGIGERETSSLLTEPKVYGRDRDKENIVHQLINNVTNPEELSIYPIIGMGGLGKTTLAQMAYNDERVGKHFDIRIWVCVSQPFDVKSVLKATIEYASRKACDLVDLGPMQQNLGDILSGRRFLLVLDDVWNEDHDKWDTLKYSLTCGAKGSSIVVTTRIKRIALLVGTLPAYHLSHLSEEDCWSLFKPRAFIVGNEENPKLVKIGKEIVKKVWRGASGCKGFRKLNVLQNRGN